MPEFTGRQLEEFRKLRNLVLVPNAVDVLHSNRGKDIWLCDGYVLVKVTDSPAVAGVELTDGLYRLQANKGLVQRDGEPRVNLARTFADWRAPDMHPVYLTGVSVTDDAAKRMIVFAEVPASKFLHEPLLDTVNGRVRVPLAINESVWLAFNKMWEDVILWHGGEFAEDGKAGPFRIDTKDSAERAYIQPARIPPNMTRIAQAIVSVAPAERMIQKTESPEEQKGDTREDA